MHFGNAIANDYVINGICLPNTESNKDLGVIFDTSLRFSSHIDSVVRKALAVLFLIMRNTRCSDSSIVLRLYKTYVLPHLEYCSQVWSPFLKKDIEKLERVQHVFTRMLWHRSKPGVAIPPYRVRLKSLSLHSLQYRRVISDLVFCFSVLRKELRLSASKYWTFRPTSERLGGFNLHYAPIYAKNHSLVFNNLFNRCARWFELLPPQVLQAPNSKILKSRPSKLDLLGTLGIQEVV
ncbi:unnamed protein product [Haemonchus placei]|uniref:Endonuclease/reverse transcript n=1 Tax=Haemonchus placei TaxID=6290 RepID=A0A0N4WT28_HAEPC|nr:unnamed protein product [Haemonchus placei]